MSRIGRVEGGAGTVVSAFLEVLGPEGTLAALEEPREPEPLHARPRHRLRVAGQERQAVAGGGEPLERLLRARRGAPAARVGVREELDVALREARAPLGQAVAVRIHLAAFEVAMAIEQARLEAAVEIVVVMWAGLAAL
jgi:hypothetical protein